MRPGALDGPGGQGPGVRAGLDRHAPGGADVPGHQGGLPRGAGARDPRADPVQLADARSRCWGTCTPRSPRCAPGSGGSWRSSRSSASRPWTRRSNGSSPTGRPGCGPPWPTLPKGSWTAEDWLDDDGITDDPIRMKCTVTVTDDEFTVDFAGSSPAVPGPVNMPFGATERDLQGGVQGADHAPIEPTNAGQCGAAAGEGRAGDAVPRRLSAAHVHAVDRDRGGGADLPRRWRRGCRIGCRPPPAATCPGS